MNKVFSFCFVGFLIGYSTLDIFAVTTAYQREQILSSHNAERQKLGIPLLSWDDTMAKEAESWAKVIAQKGVLEHSSASDRHNMGENIYYMMTTAKSLPSNGGDAVSAWMKEKPYYSYGTNSCTSGQECRHYTQIIWKNTTRIGCGRATKKTPSGTSVYWVCRYDPIGNYTGQKPY